MVQAPFARYSTLLLIIISSLYFAIHSPFGFPYENASDGNPTVQRHYIMVSERHIRGNDKRTYQLHFSIPRETSSMKMERFDIRTLDSTSGSGIVTRREALTKSAIPKSLFPTRKFATMKPSADCLWYPARRFLESNMLKSSLNS